MSTVKGKTHVVKSGNIYTDGTLTIKRRKNAHTVVLNDKGSRCYCENKRYKKAQKPHKGTAVMTGKVPVVIMMSCKIPPAVHQITSTN